MQVLEIHFLQWTGWCQTWGTTCWKCKGNLMTCPSSLMDTVSAPPPWWPIPKWGMNLPKFSKPRPRPARLREGLKRQEKHWRILRVAWRKWPLVTTFRIGLMSSENPRTPRLGMRRWTKNSSTWMNLRLTPLMRSGRKRSWSSGPAEAEELWNLQDPKVSITVPGKMDQEERSRLELQDPECPGIPWRLSVWKEHTFPWRAAGNNCPHSPGMEIPWSRWWCSVLASVKIHPDLWPISVLCCAFAPPASECPSNLSSSVN